MKLISTLTILALAAAGSVFAADPPAAPAQAPAAVAPAPQPAAKVQIADDDQVVCRTETPTGHRIAERFCATKKQWAARAEKGRNNLERLQAQSTGVSCSDGGC